MFKVGDKIKVKAEYMHIFAKRPDKFDSSKILEITTCKGLDFCKFSGKTCQGGMVVEGTTQKCWFYNSSCILEKI